MANYIETATICQKELDTAAVADTCTGWMDANAENVIYDGGREVKIPKVTMDGLADYDKVNGYTEGDIDFRYQTEIMTQDRGRGFTLDATTTNETNYAANISRVMGEFQREHVIPEIDAYRISKIASKIIDAYKSKEITGMCIHGQTLIANTTAFNVLKAIKHGIAAIRNYYSGPLTIQINTEVLTELEVELVGRLSYVEISKGGVVTKVPAIDMCPLIETPSSRMISAITLNDGKTEGQEKGGWKKGSSALDINFLILPTKGPIAVSKLDKFRIFDPETYQRATAWHADYRRYHDLWIPDNKLKIMYGSFKDKLPLESGQGA
ncbi:MAG: hypothetical protein K2N34_14900 [Lachnospiraceae bacterium]|nr:hypothetical protein [Lachnospiraceae bacterium]